MIENLIYFYSSISVGLGSYASLLLMRNKKPQIWKIGMLVGVVSGFFSAMGYLSESLNPVPFITFFLGTGIMLTCVTIGYFKIPIPADYSDQERTQVLHVREDTLKQLGIGVGIALALGSVVGFVQGQREGQVLQSAFAGIVYRLADEVKQLHEVVTIVVKDVRELKNQARKTAVGDSIATIKSTSNQEKLLRQTRKRQ